MDISIPLQVITSNVLKFLMPHNQRKSADSPYTPLVPVNQLLTVLSHWQIIHNDMLEVETVNDNQRGTDHSLTTWLYPHQDPGNSRSRPTNQTTRHNINITLALSRHSGLGKYVRNTPRPPPPPPPVWSSGSALVPINEVNYTEPG